MSTEPTVDPRANQTHGDTPEALAKDVMNVLASRMTDEVFKIIQNDHAFMTRYLHLIETYKLEGVNPVIGRLVKEKFHLQSTEERETKPESTIVQSYTRLA